MTEDDKELVKRLRKSGWGSNVTDTLNKWTTERLEAAERIKALTAEKDKLGNLLLETADRNAREIVRLEVENERLREALEPFASAACDLDNEPDRVDMWEHPVAMNVTAGDFRRARAALGDTQ
jgi:hypothetical protein